MVYVLKNNSVCIIKELSMYYYLFLVILTILSLFNIVNYYPNYEEVMFPLFKDFTTILLFSPSFFILTFSVLGQIILSFINARKKYIVLSLLLVLDTCIFLIILPYDSVPSNLLVSSFSILVSIIFFSLMQILKNTRQ